MIRLYTIIIFPVVHIGVKHSILLQRKNINYRYFKTQCSGIYANQRMTVSNLVYYMLKNCIIYIDHIRSRKARLTTGGIRCADHATPSIRKSWHYFANKGRSLGRHSSLADQSHGVFYIYRPYSTVWLVHSRRL
jgi:hypothetical protein